MIAVTNDLDHRILRLQAHADLQDRCSAIQVRDANTGFPAGALHGHLSDSVLAALQA